MSKGTLSNLFYVSETSNVTASSNKSQIEFDPFCDPNNPKIITFRDISLASNLIKNGVEYTPCTQSKLSSSLGMTVFLKKEFQQYTGRVMPLAAPFNKIKKCQNYGANVIIKGEDISESKTIAMEIAKEKKLTYINGYDHPHIIAGQGTIGIEICEQVEDIDAVVIPCGGGGLFAGVAAAIKAIKPKIQIIGVESEKCSSFTNALKSGSPIFTPVQPTLADGLAIPCVGFNAFATAQPLLDKMIVVKEEWIALAILELVESDKCVVEGAGAAGLAAILPLQLNELKNKRIVVLLCGGNINTNILLRCLERGLIAKGQMLRFKLVLADIPGVLTDLCKVVSTAEAFLVDIVQERRFIREILSVEVKVVCETRDYNHSLELRKILIGIYPGINFDDLSME